MCGVQFCSVGLAILIHQRSKESPAIIVAKSGTMQQLAQSNQGRSLAMCVATLDMKAMIAHREQNVTCVESLVTWREHVLTKG